MRMACITTENLPEEFCSLRQAEKHKGESNWARRKTQRHAQSYLGSVNIIGLGEKGWSYEMYFL